MPGSDLRRRSRNGPIRSANWRALVGSRPRLDRGRPHLAEGVAAAEQARGGPVEDRPQLGEVVLDRGPGQGDPGGGGMVRSARAVEERAFLTCWASSATTRSQAIAPSAVGVAAHGAVGGQHEAGVGAARGTGRVEVARPPPWKRRTRDPGGEAADLGLPVAEQAGRADDQGRARRRRGSVPVQVQRDEGDGLAQSHVVGQAAAEAEAGQRGQPGQAVPLVVPQLRPRAPAAGAPAPSWPRRPAARAPSAATRRPRPGCRGAGRCPARPARCRSARRRSHGWGRRCAAAACGPCARWRGRRPSSHRAASAAVRRRRPARPSRPRSGPRRAARAASGRRRPSRDRAAGPGAAPRAAPARSPDPGPAGGGGRPGRARWSRSGPGRGCGATARRRPGRRARRPRPPAGSRGPRR